MNFEETLEIKEYFSSLNEAIDFRKPLWEKNVKHIEDISDFLFDNYDIEDSIFIINEFFDRNVYSTEKIDVLIELSKFEFEELLENKVIDRFQSDDIQYHVYVKDEKRTYSFNNFFKESNLKIDVKQHYGK